MESLDRPITIVHVKVNEDLPLKSYWEQMVIEFGSKQPLKNR